MTIIDRYLLRQFVQTFFICFVSLTGLYIVIDAFGHLEEFIDASRKQQASLPLIMLKYYAYHTLPFFDQTKGVLPLIAAMFTVTWIQRHNELTAIEAAGISKSRVVKPIIVAVVVIAGIAVLNREVLIPSCRAELSHDIHDLGGTNGKELTPQWDYDTNIFFHRGKTYADKQRIQDPEFRLPDIGDYDTLTITAEEAFYLEASRNRPEGYWLVNVESPKNIDEIPTIKDGKKVRLLASLETSWLKPGECFIPSGVSFKLLESGTATQDLMSTPQLISSLRNPSIGYSAKSRVTAHSRFVQPLLDITLLFLGLPLVVVRGNRNMFLAIGLCLAVVAAFMLVVMSCQALGSNSMMLSPALAAWLPLIIFVPIAAGLADPAHA